MLDEGRKRDAAANAVLALSFAANAAQSPQSLVSSGKVEAPGVANMQRLMDPRKKRKDLDLQRVSHSARNRLRTETYDDDMFRQHSKERPIDDQGYTPKSRTSSFLKKMKDLNLSQEPTKKKKKKTFKEFVEESYVAEGQSREDAEKKRLAKDNPDEWRVRKVGRSGEESWTTKRKSAISGQGSRRRQRLKALTFKEILAFTKRNLKPKPKELAKKAQKIETADKTAQSREATSQTKATGTKHVVDHKQPQQDKRKPENRERFERVSPGDVSSNRRVLPEPENLEKGSKPPKKGEPGYGTTRSGAIRKVVRKAEGHQ